MTTAQFSKLRHAQIGAIGTAQIQSLTTDQASAMTAAQAVGLTSAQVAAMEAADVGKLSTSMQGCRTYDDSNIQSDRGPGGWSEHRAVLETDGRADWQTRYQPD